MPTPLLGSGALDLAVAHYEDIPPDLRASMLYENRLVAVARARHPTLRGRLTMRQFVSLPQVVVFPHSTSTEDELRRAFGAAGEPFRLVAAMQPLGAAVAMVAATDAIALVSEPVARFHAKALPLQVLEAAAKPAPAEGSGAGGMARAQPARRGLRVAAQAAARRGGTQRRRPGGRASGRRFGRVRRMTGRPEDADGDRDPDKPEPVVRGWCGAAPAARPR